MLLCLAHPGPSEPLFTGEPMRVKRLAPGSKIIMAFCRHCENFLRASTTRKNLLTLGKAHYCVDTAAEKGAPSCKHGNAVRDSPYHQESSKVRNCKMVGCKYL